MIADVITPLRRIKIDPILIVGRNLHLCRIAMVQIRSALVVFRRVVIVRIVHVRIVVEPLPILRIGSCPLLSISLLCRNGIGQRAEQAKRAENGERNRAKHHSNLLKTVLTEQQPPCPLSTIYPYSLEKNAFPLSIHPEEPVLLL